MLNTKKLILITFSWIIPLVFSWLLSLTCNYIFFVVWLKLSRYVLDKLIMFVSWLFFYKNYIAFCQNDGTCEVLFNTKWYVMSIYHQKTVMHLINRKQNGTTFSIGPFAKLNMQTFYIVSNFWQYNFSLYFNKVNSNFVFLDIKKDLLIRHVFIQFFRVKNKVVSKYFKIHIGWRKWEINMLIFVFIFTF